MPIQNYMNDIQKIVPLPDEKITALFKQYEETPTIEIRNILVEQNLKLVFKVASMYRRTGILFADLVAEGNLGLIRGIEKYRLSFNVKPGYYLFKWISAKVLRHIVRNAHLVKLGTTQAQRKLFFNLSKTKAKARAQGLEMSNEEIANLLGVKVEEVDEMDQRLSAPVVRLETAEPDESAKHSSYIVNRMIQSRINNSEAVDTPDALLEREERSQYVQEIVTDFMSRLNDTQRGVFEARFLAQDEPDTFETIGEKLNGLTKQRVQQIDAELKVKFRKYLSHNQIQV